MNKKLYKVCNPVMYEGYFLAEDEEHAKRLFIKDYRDGGFEFESNFNTDHMTVELYEGDYEGKNEPKTLNAISSGVANPHCFAHIDTANLYADVFADITGEDAWPHCFPGYNGQMPLGEAYDHMNNEDGVYKRCHAMLVDELKRYADEENSRYRTDNVNYEEIATTMMDYWTEILRIEWEENHEEDEEDDQESLH